MTYAYRMSTWFAVMIGSSSRMSLTVGKRDGALRRQYAPHFGFQLELALHERDKAVHERLEPAAQRIAEARVRALRLGHRLQRAVDHLLEIRQRHASAEPRCLHFGE